MGLGCTCTMPRGHAVMVIGLDVPACVRPAKVQADMGRLAVGLVVAVHLFSAGWELRPAPHHAHRGDRRANAALLNGDPRHVVETTLGTLGMFTFKGDPNAL